ncbi:MAG: polysaccharide deacetylase family protein, partial [Chloroflexota bacterium]
MKAPPVFLRAWFVIFTLIILFTTFMVQAQAEEGTGRVQPAPMLEIPPTIMFHARSNQRHILPELIDDLLADGYQFTTYQQYYTAVREGEPLENPIILTFDDLTLVEGSSNFHYYAQVMEILTEKGIPAVFAVVTEPVVFDTNNQIVQITEQNPDYWQQAKTWAAQGIEFATHTQSHPNLDNPALTQADFNREIVGSAQLIEHYLGAPVMTLITPYGSGVTQDGEIDPRILTALDGTALHFVVGIAGMRQPRANGQGVYGVGRIMPDDQQPETTLLQTLIAETQRWRDFN